MNVQSFRTKNSLLYTVYCNIHVVKLWFSSVYEPIHTLERSNPFVFQPLGTRTGGSENASGTRNYCTGRVAVLHRTCPPLVTLMWRPGPTRLLRTTASGVISTSRVRPPTRMAVASKVTTTKSTINDVTNGNGKSVFACLNFPLRLFWARSMWIGSL